MKLTLEQKIDEILTEFAAYCDSSNREIEYDTSDNIDFDEAKQQLLSLIQEEKKQPTISLLDLKYIIDDNIPTCGEKDCETCSERHIRCAKAIYDRLQALKQGEKR